MYDTANRLTRTRNDQNSELSANYYGAGNQRLIFDEAQGIIQTYYVRDGGAVWSEPSGCRAISKISRGVLPDPATTCFFICPMGCGGSHRRSVAGVRACGAARRSWAGLRLRWCGAFPSGSRRRPGGFLNKAMSRELRRRAG